MANLHWAISRRSFLFACLLIFVNSFSAIAKFSGVSVNRQEKKQDKIQKKQQQEDPKSERNRVEVQDPVSKKPDIKQVPKARKQLKPSAVKPKVKPVRIIKPKIKKP